MRKSEIFLYFSVCFILGIATRSLFSFDIFYSFVFLLICLVASAVVWARFRYRIILLGAIFLFLGILRYEISLPKVNQNHIAFYNGQQVELIGQISSEPDARERYVKLTISNLQLTINKKQSKVKNKKVKGKVLVNAYKYGGDYNYGDWVKVRCKLEKPGIFESGNKGRDFDYGQYLSVKGVYAVCYRPDFVKKVAVDLSGLARIKTRIYAKVIDAKQKFKNIIDQNLPLPQSGLLNAMLLGYRRELSPEIIDQFSKTGVAHIIAISGLHITFIAGILFYFFIILGVPRQKSFWPAILILFLYVLMIGFRASAIRAFIMGAALFYALKIGRLKNSINILILAAVILLLINPKLLFFDISFQLSFLAVLGILWFYPFLSNWLASISLAGVKNMFHIKQRKHEDQSTQKISSVFGKGKFCSVVALTLSAQALTLPLVFYYFGRIPIISPITNLLILPLLPVILVLGILMILLGLIWSKLAFGIGILLWLILSYIIKVTSILS